MPVEVNIMSADTAKSLTSKRIEQTITNEVIMVAEAIKSAIEKGQYSCFIYAALKSETIQRLKSLGYKVASELDRNETYYSISWAEGCVLPAEAYMRET